MLNQRWSLVSRILVLGGLYCLGCYQQATAQGPTNNWFFTYGNRLSFDEYPPVVTQEAYPGLYQFSSAMSDSDGNLLFYANSTSIINKDNVPMVNGRGGIGYFATVLIIPFPAKENFYYVFWAGNRKIFYSVVDMSKNNGLGEVVLAYQPLLTGNGSYLEAVHHGNDRDFWLTVIMDTSSVFHVYPITGAGIGAPIVQDLALQSSGIEWRDWIPYRLAPTGNRLGLYSNGFHLFDFDDETGRISNHRKLDVPRSRNYMFSPNGNLLYMAWRDERGNIISQYNLKLNKVEDIINSQFDMFYPTGINLHDMQLGPDGNIYLTDFTTSGYWDIPYTEHSKYLHVILNTDAPGACIFLPRNLTLKDKSYTSLPNFVQSYLRTKDPLINYKNPCDTDSVKFRLFYGYYFDSLRWDFGDGTYSSTRAFHIYKKYARPGDYHVTATIFKKDTTLTVDTDIHIFPGPRPDLPDSLKFCDTDSVVLSTGEQGSILWSDGTTDTTMVVHNTGKYWLTVTDSGCVASDTVWMREVRTPVCPLTYDVIRTCDDLPVRVGFEPCDGINKYLWSNGHTDSYMYVDSSGVYVRTLSNDICHTSDSTEVIFGRLADLSVHIESDSVAHDEPVRLSAGSSTQLINWQWHFGDGYSSYSPTPSHKYWQAGQYTIRLRAINMHGCSAEIDGNIYVKEHLFIPNVFTPNNDGYNDYFEIVTNTSADMILTVWNRQGRQVYASDDYGNDWSGDDLPSGVYYYQLRRDGSEQQTRGVVHLLK